MNYNLMYAFEYEILNKIDLVLNKYPEDGFYLTVKNYLLGRIQEMKNDQKLVEDRLLIQDRITA